MNAPSRSKRRVVLLVILSCAVFLPGLGRHELWSPDEPRFALIAQDMLHDGDYVVPHLLGQVYTEKPPFQVWLVALASLPIGRVTEWSARFPSALAAIGSVLVTFLLGRRLFGERAGWYSALVLLTTPYFLVRGGRWCSTDTILAFFLLLAIALGYLWTATDGPGRRRLAWGFFASCAMATLTKGPVGLVLPAGILVLFLVLERRWREAIRFPWISGAIVFVVIVAPWYLLFGGEAGGSALGVVALTENLQRYLRAWNNVEPFYFYLFRYPASFLPWVVFFPAAAVALIRARSVPERPALKYALLWFGLIFVFFSISTGKRTIYLLPLFPAAALVLGWLVDQGQTVLGETRARWMRISAVVFFWVVGAVGVSLPIMVEKVQPGAALSALPAGVVAVVGSLVGAVLAWRGLGSRWVHCAAATVGAGTALFAILLLPALDRYENVRAFSSRIAAVVPAKAPLATERSKREAFLFYTGLQGPEIRGDDDLRRIFSSDRPAYCVMDEAHWRESRRTPGVSGTVVLHSPISGDDWVLVANGEGVRRLKLR